MTDAGAPVAVPPLPTPAMRANMLPQPDPTLATDVVWQQLEQLFGWYEKRAHRNRLGYQGLKLVTLIVGAAVTVLAAQHAPSALTASLAGMIVAVEGAQQLFQLHANWISYRESAEALRREAFAFAAAVAPYDGERRREQLAEAIGRVSAREGASWTKAVQHPG